MVTVGLRARARLAALALALAGCDEMPQETAEGAAEGVSAEGPADGGIGAEGPDVIGEYCELTGQEEALGDCARFERQYADLDAGRDAFSPQETMQEGETRTVSYAVTRLPKAVQGEGGEIAEAVPPPPPPPPPSPPSSILSPSPQPPFTDPVPGSRVPLPSASATGPSQEEIDAAIAETDERNASALGDAAGEVETGQIKVARFMYACLRSGPALKVVPEGCQSRDTREDPQVIWNWEVTATAPGTHQLNLRSGVEVRTRAGDPRRIGQRAVNRTITVAVSRIGWFERAMGDSERWLTSPVKMIGALTALLLAIAGLVAAVRKLRKGGDSEG